MIKLCLDYTGVQGSRDQVSRGPRIHGSRGSGSMDPGVQGPGVQVSRGPGIQWETPQMTPTHTSAPLVKVNSADMNHKV